jgi:hypothetical protein
MVKYSLSFRIVLFKIKSNLEILGRNAAWALSR